MTDRPLHIYYRGVCTACEKTAKTSHDPKWLTPFFMPQHCPNCGEYRSQIDGWCRNKDWRTDVVKFKFVKKPFELLKPSTWFGEWVELKDSEA